MQCSAQPLDVLSPIWAIRWRAPEHLWASMVAGHFPVLLSCIILNIRAPLAISADTCSKCRWTSWVLLNRISFSRWFCINHPLHWCWLAVYFFFLFRWAIVSTTTEWIETSIYLCYFHALHEVTVAKATNEVMRLLTNKKKKKQQPNKVYIVAKYVRVWRFVIVHALSDRKSKPITCVIRSLIMLVTRVPSTKAAMANLPLSAIFVTCVINFRCTAIHLWSILFQSRSRPKSKCKCHRTS